MIKVLVIQQPNLNGVTWWRCFRPLSILRKQYRGQIDFTFKHRDLNAVDIDFHDVVLILRPTGPDILEYIRLAKQKGVPVIIDIDDDLINLPPNHPMYFEYTRNRRHIEEFFRLADRVWVSTEQLLYVTDAIGRGTVIPNAILPTDLPDEPAPDLRRWAWRGTSVHLSDIVTHADWYERLKSSVKEFAWIGWVPPLNHLDNAKFYPYESDPSSYMDSIRRQQFNVIWKPLQENLFNKAKSNIAWLEATIGGGVCVTNFALEDQWRCCSLYGLEHYEEQVERWMASREAILEHYNLDTTNKLRLNDIKNLV
jgi:hypothetical protein